MKCDRRPYRHPELEATFCIPLTQGKVALVDESDLGVVGNLKWQAMTRGGRWYARRTTAGPNGAYAVYMHRAIVGSPGRGAHVDHINHNGLDNRRLNLRIVPVSVNIQNRRSAYGKSRFLGVSWRAKQKKWWALIRGDGRRIHLGYFDNETQAARAYDKAALELYGPLARTNFGANGIHGETA